MKKIFSGLLAVVFVLSIMPISLGVSAATSDFASGTGSAYSPYIIETKEQLNNVRKYPSACFKLNSDLEFVSDDFDETGMFYNDGKGFEPIGTYETPFSGSFDGNNHYISGLYINIKTTTKKLAVGLFGYSTGSISNLGVADGLIRAETSATRAYLAVGGIAGDSKYGLNRCYNSCRVSAIATGTWSVALAGGITGTTDGEITNCYNVGNVYAQTYTSSAGESYAGGVVAEISGYVSETVIQSCLNVGDVSCEGATAYCGVIAGYSYQGNSMWCYYRLYSGTPFGNSSAQKTYVYGLTEAQMAQERSFDGLAEGWTLTTSFGHPVLKGINHIPMRACYHLYDYVCASICSVCGEERLINNHTYSNACDADCNVCGLTRVTGDHTYDNACDIDCNHCGLVRQETHVYSGNCDDACNTCGMKREAESHNYDDVYDVECNTCGAWREAPEHPLSFGGNSVSEDVSGLAFRFNVDCAGVAMNGTTAIYDNATVDGYKLLGMGAMVTNGFDTRDVPAVYLWELKEMSASFAVRVIHIPLNGYNTDVTATPYIILEIDGVVTTVYGEAQTCSYNGAKN